MSKITKQKGKGDKTIETNPVKTLVQKTFEEIKKLKADRDNCSNQLNPNNNLYKSKKKKTTKQPKKVKRS